MFVKGRKRIFTKPIQAIVAGDCSRFAKQILHSSRWRKVSEELPEYNKEVLVKVNIQGYIHFEVDRLIYGEWMNGDNGIIEWKYIN